MSCIIIVFVYLFNACKNKCLYWNIGNTIELKFPQLPYVLTYSNAVECSYTLRHLLHSPRGQTSSDQLKRTRCLPRAWPDKDQQRLVHGGVRQSDVGEFTPLLTCSAAEGKPSRFCQRISFLQSKTRRALSPLTSAVSPNLDPRDSGTNRCYFST